MTIPELMALDIDAQRLILVLAKSGMTDDEIATTMGITLHKLRYLFEKYPEFKQVYDEMKEEPNFKVEQALFRRALGYTVREVTKKDDKPVQVVIKDIAPDTVACIFWLKNRAPKRWRDVVEHQHSLRDRMDRAHGALDERRRMLTSGAENEKEVN